jgi:tetratricopeptide (TPR) repeat protein
MSRLGRFEDAKRAARTTLKLGSSRLPGLAAVELAAAGEFGGAIALARGHAEAHHDAWALAEIAGALQAAGLPDQAMAYIAEATDVARGAPSARTAASLVRVLVRAQEATAARDQLAQAEAAIGRGRMADADVRDLARAMIALGDFDRAEELVDKSLGPSAQATAQAHLVAAYADQGEWTRAEALARRIRTGREAARAYLALARGTNAVRPHAYLALALHHGWWPDCLPELLGIDAATADIAISATVQG